MDDLGTRPLALRDFRCGLMRWRRMIAALLGLGALATLTGAALINQTFTAGTRLVLSGTAETLAAGGLPRAADRRLDIVREKLLVTGEMVAIADVLGIEPEADPYRRARTVRTMVSVAVDRGDVRVTRAFGALDIRVSAATPGDAKRATDALAARAVALEASERARGLTGERSRLRAERARADERLRTAQGRLAAFEAANRGALPGSAGRRARRAAELAERRRDRDAERLRLERARARLAGDDLPLDIRSGRAFRDLEAELARKQGAFAPGHPGRRLAERSVRAAERQSDRERASRRSLIDDRLAALALAEEAHRTETLAIARDEAAAPGVAAVHAGMVRRIRALAAQRDDLARRLLAFDRALEREEAGDSERLVALEPANLPVVADGRGRRAFAVLGLLASVGFASGAALIREFFAGTIRSAADFDDRLGFAPLAVTPAVAPDVGAFATRHLARLGLAGLVLVPLFRPLNFLGGA